MQLSTIFAVLSATAALAAPSINKRSTTAVYLCNDRDFTGYCVHIESEVGACVPLAEYLNDQVSSAGPDEGSICYFFVNPDCNVDGGLFMAKYPGYADLSVTPVPEGSTTNFEDQISSYHCFRTDED